MGQKHKRFRESRTPFSLRDIRKNPRSMYARVPQAMAQFVLKIEKLSHIMGPAPILEMARAYGLRPRLWLLVLAPGSAFSFIFMQIKVIFIRMVPHLDSLWNRGTRELGNGLFLSNFPPFLWPSASNPSSVVGIFSQQSFNIKRGGKRKYCEGVENLMGSDVIKGSFFLFLSRLTQPNPLPCTRLTFVTWSSRTQWKMKNTTPCRNTTTT